MADRPQRPDGSPSSPPSFEGRYRALFEHSPDAIYLHDLEGRFLDANPAAVELLGYRREEIRDLHFSDLLTDERELGKAFAAVERLTATGGLREPRRYVLRRKDGTRVWVEVVAAPVYEAGRPVAIQGIARDLTERMQAEESVRFQALLLDSVEQAAIATDDAGRIVYCNHAAERLYGFTAAEVVGRKVVDVTVPRPSREQADEIMERLRSGRSWSGELEVQRMDGTVFPAEVSNSPVLDDDGRVVAVIGLSQDVSERRRVEADHRLQAAVLEAAAEAMMITDLDARILWVNAAFTELTGYGREEAIGEDPVTLLKSGVQEPSFYRELWDSILAGRVWRGELVNRRKDGSLYPEEMSITPVKDARGETTHFIGVKRDLTHLKKLEAQYLQAQKMETVGRLAGGVAHDFNNLLTVIQGAAELAADQLPGGDPGLENLRLIVDAGDRAARLTRQLLAFSRKQILQPVPFDLAAFVRDWRRMLQRLIGERIDILVDVAAEAAWVRADPGQIEQVLMNLVVNARDAMPEGGVLTLAVRETEVTASDAEAGGEVPPGTYVAMTVRDTGAGMDEATRLQIFEPFFTTKEAGRGTGLGLSTVYGIVQQSGGFVTVDSEPGRGSVFVIYLPREAAAAAQAEPAVAPAGPGRHESVLVVEDDPALRRLVEAILLGAGYRVVSAASGDEALALLERSARLPDLLFTDVVLPGMSGHDLARRVSERGPGVKVLFTSGYTDDADLREEVLEGRTSFLAKPYTPSSLARAVREALDEP